LRPPPNTAVALCRPRLRSIRSTARRGPRNLGCPAIRAPIPRCLQGDSADDRLGAIAERNPHPIADRRRLLCHGLAAEREPQSHDDDPSHWSPLKSARPTSDLGVKGVSRLGWQEGSPTRYLFLTRAVRDCDDVLVCVRFGPANYGFVIVKPATIPSVLWANRRPKTPSVDLSMPALTSEALS